MYALKSCLSFGLQLVSQVSPQPQEADKMKMKIDEKEQIAFVAMAGFMAGLIFSPLFTIWLMY